MAIVNPATDTIARLWRYTAASVSVREQGRLLSVASGLVLT
jgi:hypothetical protein